VRRELALQYLREIVVRDTPAAVSRRAGQNDRRGE
jgi:hypothetical protein